MASSNRQRNESQRPRQIHISKSFSKLEPVSPDRASPRSTRASTIQNGVIPDRLIFGQSNERDGGNTKSQPDAFERSTQEDGESEIANDGPGKLTGDVDELPIELISLTDSFIDSLSAKVHPTPPTIDKLSSLFQEFYAVASNHINTHISTLSLRQHRGASTTSSTSSLSSTASKFRAKAGSLSKDRPNVSPQPKEVEQQMLTAEEVAERKKARKILEQKRLGLEEAVERRVCEAIYERIWRHRSTQDEAQDEKLRSKTAALSVVGIGLKDLGIELGQNENQEPDADEGKEKEVREWLQEARDELIAMNNENYPLGKLQHLKAAHKGIVDTLSHFHPSSSADEIMPMMIYTLITSRPEGIDVISNLYFIQRFRNENKIDGEAAYCLTNLEAAITFLETVDLASLRADEVLSGPVKTNSRPNTPRSERTEPMIFTTSPGFSTPVVNTADSSPPISKTTPSPSALRPQLQSHNRRLSGIFQPPAVLGAAGDAVLNTADQGFKTIGNSLGDSYKFLVGKLKERQEESPGQTSEIIVPKTLDEARKLVSTPPPEDDGSVSGESSLQSTEPRERKRSDSGSSSKADDKVLSMIGGRKTLRDHSTDSLRSSGSGNKKVAFVEEGNNEKAPSPLPAPPGSMTSGNPAIVESMRNLGNTLNSMNKFAGMAFPRGFGRPTPPPAAKPIADGGVAELTSAFPDLAPSLPPKEVKKIAPPIKRFMELKNPGELRINEVLELLRDYRRLAGALKDAGAF